MTSRTVLSAELFRSAVGRPAYNAFPDDRIEFESAKMATN